MEHEKERKKILVDGGKYLGFMKIDEQVLKMSILAQKALQKSQYYATLTLVTTDFSFGADPGICFIRQAQCRVL